jgi:hypothetical protein
VSPGWCFAIAVAAAGAGCGPPRAPAEPVVAAPIDAAPLAVTPEPPDAAPVPRPLDRDMPALAAGQVALVTAVAEALASAGTDCARAADGVVALRAQFKDVRDATARVLIDGRGAQLEPELDARREPIDAALARMRPTLDACKSDARLDEALEGLGAGG